METIRGIAIHVLSRSEENGNVFARIRYETPNGLVDAKFSGISPDLKVGDCFVADGDWQENTYRGNKDYVFRARSVRPDLPATKAGAAVWLAGIFDKDRHGVTAQSIQAFVNAKGDAVASLCERTPELIVGISTSPGTFKTAILQDWGRRLSGRRAVRLLEDSGVGSKAIASVLDAFRDDAFDVLKADPYRASRVPRFGFSNADLVGAKLEIAQKDDRRVTAAVLEVVEESRTSGDTYLTVQDLSDRLKASFAIDEATTIAYLQKYGRSTEIPFVIDTRAGRLVVMSREIFIAERNIAKAIAGMLKTGRSNDPTKAKSVVAGIMAQDKFQKFDSIQRSAVEMAVSQPISILTGGPGTGKSTVTEAITAAAKKLDGANILLCAPTGKAAKRLEEASGQAATTLHRLLEAKENKQTGGSVFGRNRNNKLKGGCFVIVDEVSMNDVILMAGLLEAMPPDGRLLLVGDRNQLPSVDAGAVLSDLMNARTADDAGYIVPRTELLNVYRQSRDSNIATGAAEIRDGAVPFMTNEYRGGLTLYEHETSGIIDRIKWIVGEVLMGQRLRYQRHHIAVLVPQAPGAAGAWEINREMSKLLNPSGRAIPGVVRGGDDDPAMPLPRVGDRVMLTENDDGNDVMNGDVGTIVDCVQKAGANGERPFVRIDFDCGKTVEYPASMWRKFILAYAITIHKSQGSQYPAVIMPVTSAHERMLDRSILYTGWTRAKSMLFLVGEREAIQAAVDNTEKSKRKTRLAEFLTKAATDLGLSPAVKAPAAAAPAKSATAPAPIQDQLPSAAPLPRPMTPLSAALPRPAGLPRPALGRPMVKSPVEEAENEPSLSPR